MKKISKTLGFIDLPMELPDDLWREHTRVGMAHTLDTGSSYVGAGTSLRVSTVPRSRVDPFQGYSQSLLPFDTDALFVSNSLEIRNYLINMLIFAYIKYCDFALNRKFAISSKRYKTYS